MNAITFIYAGELTKSHPLNIINTTESESLCPLKSNLINGNAAYINLKLKDTEMIFHTASQLDLVGESKRHKVSTHLLLKTIQVERQFSTLFVIETSSVELYTINVEQVKNDLQKGYMKLLSN